MRYSKYEEEYFCKVRDKILMSDMVIRGGREESGIKERN